jgi:excisionase family DNA binding protein
MLSRPAMQTPAAGTVPRLALSVRETAEALGISERTLAAAVQAGTAPPSFLFGRLRLFPVRSVERWLQDQVLDIDATPEMESEVRT